MKNGILISVLTVCLVGCGGESGSETHTEITDFSLDLKGIEEQPTLTNAEISEGDSASLNTNYTGNIIEHSSVQFSFTLAEDKQVALVLSSGVSDLDLSIYGNNKSLYSEFEGSNELIIVDAVVRLIPGVLNDSEAALNDSFQDGERIDSPYYTRPAEYRGMKVPEVLLSGNDKEIKKWKEEQSKNLTKKWRDYNN